MIWAMRLIRLIFVIIIFLLARYFLLRELSPYDFHYDLQSILKWMECHPDLSGWAQFAGAMAAILIAIAVPAWQRHGQNLDRWRDANELNASLALLSFYLLGEVRNYLDGYLRTNSMPREFARRDSETSDLLQRIHSLENRENKQDRITRLFHARGAIHQTANTMTSQFSQPLPLAEEEISLLRERITFINKLIEEAEAENDKAIHARNRGKLWLLSRVFYSIILFIIKGRS